MDDYLKKAADCRKRTIRRETDWKSQLVYEAIKTIFRKYSKSIPVHEAMHSEIQPYYPGIVRCMSAIRQDPIVQRQYMMVPMQKN